MTIRQFVGAKVLRENNPKTEAMVNLMVGNFCSILPKEATAPIPKKDGCIYHLGFYDYYYCLFPPILRSEPRALGLPAVYHQATLPVLCMHLDLGTEDDKSLMCP